MKSIIVEDGHINVNLNDVAAENDYHVCGRCASKTVLVSAIGSCWEYDPEPFKSGEEVELSGEPSISSEITGHYCMTCHLLTSVCINIY